MNAARVLAVRGKSIDDAGGLVMEVVGIDGVVDKSQLDGWITASNLPITAVHDPNDMLGQSKAGLRRREFSYIVDPTTMKILKAYDGDTTGLVQPPPVNMAIDDILARLKM